MLKKYILHYTQKLKEIILVAICTGNWTKTCLNSLFLLDTKKFLKSQTNCKKVRTLDILGDFAMKCLLKNKTYHFKGD